MGQSDGDGLGDGLTWLRGTRAVYGERDGGGCGTADGVLPYAHYQRHFEHQPYQRYPIQ